jgi:hypothetical protein
MPVRNARFAVPTGATNTPLDLRAATGVDKHEGDSILVKNSGAVTVGLGGEAMDDTNSFPLEAGAAIGVDLGRGDVLYARVAGGTAGQVAVLAVQ